MHELLESILGELSKHGMEGLKIGKNEWKAPRLQSLTKIEGYGDTINVGDIFYHQSSRDKEFEGPWRLDAVFPDGNDGGYRFSDVGQSGAWTALYDCKNSILGSWKRKFKLADKETTEKVNGAFKYEHMYLRAYYALGPKGNTKNVPVMIPASWIVWVGDLDEVLKNYKSHCYGYLERKQLVRFVKSGFYTSYKMNSKIDIPADFPVKIETKIKSRKKSNLK